MLTNVKLARLQTCFQDEMSILLGCILNSKITRVAQNTENNNHIDHLNSKITRLVKYTFKLIKYKLNIFAI